MINSLELCFASSIEQSDEFSLDLMPQLNRIVSTNWAFLTYFLKEVFFSKIVA